ncbi:hypothetical protein ARSEF4850_006370 [Beauveria asiatica]
MRCQFQYFFSNLKITMTAGEAEKDMPSGFALLGTNEKVHVAKLSVNKGHASRSLLDIATRLDIGAPIIMQQLYNIGAAVNASLNIFKRDDEEMMGDTIYTTAISMAAMTGNAALVRILLEAGAKVNSTCFMGISVLGYTIEANNIETRQDTALLTAVARDKLDFAELLLPLVDPNHTGNAGDTPLRLAVQQQNDSMVSLLLSDPRTNPNNMTELPSIFTLTCSLLKRL